MESEESEYKCLWSHKTCKYFWSRKTCKYLLFSGISNALGLRSRVFTWAL